MDKSLIEGLNGNTFEVGDQLPDGTYENRAGMVAAIINPNIPEGVFILIREHTIIKIIDARDADRDFFVDLGEEMIDAIGINESDFETVTDNMVSRTRH